MAATGRPKTRASPGTTRRSLLARQTMDLPHTEPSGELDYHTLGNMITATILGEVLYASYADHEHGNQVCGYRPDIDWQYYYKEKDVVVLKKRLVNSKMCCFMGRGVIDAPLEQVAAYIRHFRNRFSWDQYIVQHEICHQLSENDWLLYMAHEAKRCLLKTRRDFFYYCRTGYLDNKYVQPSISVEHPSYPPRPPYVRADILQGTGWVVEKYDGSECSTLVSYLAHLDLKQLPPVIVNRVLRRQPLSIHYIRHCIITPISTEPSLDPSIALSDDAELSMNVNMDVPYEDSNPVNYFTNRYSERSQRFSRASSSPVYPWVKCTGNNQIDLRPKSSTFSAFSSSNSGYSIQPLRDDSVSPAPDENGPDKRADEVTDKDPPELEPVQDTPPDPTLEATSDQLIFDLPPRCRAFSTSLPDLDLSNGNDLPSVVSAELSPRVKSSPSRIQGHQHFSGLLRPGLLTKSNNGMTSSASRLSSSF